MDEMDPSSGNAGMSGHDMGAMLQAPSDHPNTVIAVQSGAWSDPDTWGGRAIPGRDAVVVIPEDVEITYDVARDVKIFAIEIDGALRFDTERDTKLVVDTVFVRPDGALEIGTQTDPLNADVTAEIVIADNGSVTPRQGRADVPGADLKRLDWDPEQLSRGLIVEGEFVAHGASKTSHLKVAEDPRAGDATLTLESAPAGWRVGDVLVVASGAYPENGADRPHPDQNEERTIVAISGETVTLDRPLDYDHVAPDDRAGRDFAVDVANLTRNVSIASEDPDQIGARGHVMVMHSGAADIRYVALKDLGRTDKSRDVDDFKLQSGENYDDFRINADYPDRRIDEAEDGVEVETPAAQITNQRGRYPLHFHHSESENIVVGVVVDGAPGWGLTQHASAADIGETIVYEAYGAGFVTETGDETGLWWSNLALDIDGRALGWDDVSKAEKSAGFNQDGGINGSGYWLQGRLIDMVDNTAASTAHAGFFWFSRGVEQRDVGRDQVNYHQLLRDDPLDQYDGPTAIHPDRPAIAVFDGNEAYDTRRAIQIIGQSPRKLNDERSLFTDFTGWEISQSGVHFQYSSKYTFDDFVLLGAEAGEAGGGQAFAGFNLGTTTSDNVISNSYVEEFNSAIFASKQLSDNKQATEYFDRVDDIGLEVIETEAREVVRVYGGELQRADAPNRSADTVVPNRFEIEFDDASLRAVGDLGIGRNGAFRTDGVMLRGEKTDSLGTIAFPFANEWLLFTGETIDAHIVERGYYVLADGRRGVVLEELFSDRGTGAAYRVKFLVTLERDWDLPAGARAVGLFSPAAELEVYLPASVAELYKVSSSPTEVPLDPPSPTGPSAAIVTAASTSDRAETVLAGPADEKVAAGGGADTVIGTGGSDSILGQGGPDEIVGGDGDDLLFGNRGGDRLSGGEGRDLIRGGYSSDTIEAEAGSDTLYGGSGDDWLDGGGWGDELFGGEGADFALGRSGRDVLVGGPGRDELRGGEGDDQLIGGTGADLLLGDRDSDTLSGGPGDDTLDGGWGDDRLNGNTGADYFVFSTQAHGDDRIIDFEDGIDQIVYLAAESRVLSFNDVSVVETVRGVRIETESGSVTVVGLDPAQVGAEDFVFL